MLPIGEAVTQFAFSPDSTKVVVLSSKLKVGGWLPSIDLIDFWQAKAHIGMWRIRDGQRLRTVLSSRQHIDDVSFSADGQHIAVLGSDRVSLWRVP
jgi:hypothetical protein